MTTNFKRRYRKTNVKEVMDLYKQGLNFSQIAKRLGCARNTVRAKVNEYIKTTGRSIPVRSKPGLSDEEIGKLLDDYDSGVKVKDIALELNISESYVYSMIRRYRE